MDKDKVNLAFKSYIDDFIVNVRFLLFMLVVLLMLSPLTTKADVLFDFQIKLAKKGNAEAQYNVGEMYETGFGVKKDMAQSKSWINKSAGQGHEPANFKLLYWDMEKNGITAGNKAKAKDLTSKAETGNPQAQYYVGQMYANGVGVKKNTNNAIIWLNKAAFVGVLAAERELTTVRDRKQRQSALAKRKAGESKRAAQRAEKKAHLEKIVQQDKMATDAALARSKNEKAAARKAAAEKAASDKVAEQAKVLAQKKAAARKRAAQKQALLKKRAADKEKRKIQFESDPCSGKSARFLSTCR